jgi:hypothetical protein
MSRPFQAYLALLCCTDPLFELLRGLVKPSEQPDEFVREQVEILKKNLISEVTELHLVSADVLKELSVVFPGKGQVKFHPVLAIKLAKHMNTGRGIFLRSQYHESSFSLFL